MQCTWSTAKIEIKGWEVYLEVRQVLYTAKMLCSLANIPFLSCELQYTHELSVP